MNRNEFQQFMNGSIRYLDGATGSNLMKAGMPAGVCPEQWILEHREVCLALQKEYVLAGTDILYCPTFSANRIKLSEYHLEDKMEEMITQLVGISAEAAKSTERKVLIAGDLTMTGRQLVPVGTMEFEELVDVYKEQIRYLDQAGVDLLVVETMMSLQEARAALIAASEVSKLPVMVTLTFEKDGRTLFGTDAITAAVVLSKLGAAAIGANCSTGPAQMQEVIKTMSSVSGIPVIAKPNAGLPMTDANGITCYSMNAEQFADEMVLLAESGATILGGCCGTSPEYIRMLKNATKNLTPKEYKESSLRYLTSERMTVSFNTDQNFIIVGERINPTGKKTLQASLRDGSMELVRAYAEEQELCGASILDINMGMNGIDEKKMMLEAIREVSCVTNLPLCLDSSHVEVLEEALRQYPGRALINSVSLEKEKFEKLLPLAARYGAMFILLPLSDKGLPENLDEKKQIIHTIVERALSLGLTKNDIIVDGLVTTVGANKQAALETLETIRYCKELGLATICGLSNISFGMPERSYINASFLTLAIQAGLTMAIANPSQDLLVSCALATDLLLNKEGSDIRYIEGVASIKERREEQAKAMAQTNTHKTACSSEEKKEHSFHIEKSAESESLSEHIQKLRKAVLKGDKKGIVSITQDAVDKGEDSSKLLNEGLLPAINLVGDYFDKGKYFLPQLIASAEAMKNAISVLEPYLLRETEAEQKPVAVIATVEGDIHDIGKNLVTLMLKNYGLTVIDLGKDVPAENIVAEAINKHADIIALSALMTTTMQRMRDVISLVKEKAPSVKVMIGGAVITEDFADEIGADGYAADAAGAVRLARKLLDFSVNS